MKHFLVLFFDKTSTQLLNEFARRLHDSYCPWRKYPEIEHHLTIQYFQCEERHYSKIIKKTEEIAPGCLKLEIKLEKIVEYLNEMNDFCCLSWQVQKTQNLIEAHNIITRPLDKLHLHHEPIEDWPPHITCFPGISAAEKPLNWQIPADVPKAKDIPALKVNELRLTRWTGSYIETLHHFK
jgi:2'-5' RNA ligase